jgi:hypothetical protein
LLSTDGGTRTAWTSTDDTIVDVAYYAPGRWAAMLQNVASLTPRLVIIDDDGGVELLAGPGWPLPDVDGPIETSGLLDPDGIVEGPAGDLFIYERSGIRHVANGQLTTWWTLPEYVFRELGLLPSGLLLATTPSEIIAISGADAGTSWAQGSFRGLDVRGTDVAGSAPGGIQTWSAITGAAVDTGFIPGPTPWDVVFGDSGGFFGTEGFDVVAVANDGGVQPVATIPDPNAGARAIARAANGDLFVADLGTWSIYRVATSGTVTTVVTLADAPSDLFVEDGGTLLITVPDAVLRVHP